jgi:hypothetical protein
MAVSIENEHNITRRKRRSDSATCYIQDSISSWPRRVIKVAVTSWRKKVLLQRCFSPRCFRKISCATRCSAFWTELPLLVSWRWRSSHKSFAYIDSFANTTEHYLDKHALVCLMLAPKSNVQTAKCPRLARFGAESVTTFPDGIISASAAIVKSQNARIVCSSA